YHALATGRAGRNLDAFLSGAELIGPLFAHGAAAADLAVVEGGMGRFDGAAGAGDLASPARAAKLLGAPVLLVLDCRALASPPPATSPRSRPSPPPPRRIRPGPGRQRSSGRAGPASRSPPARPSPSSTRRTWSCSRPPARSWPPSTRPPTRPCRPVPPACTS